MNPPASKHVAALWLGYGAYALGTDALLDALAILDGGDVPQHIRQGLFELIGQINSWFHDHWEPSRPVDLTPLFLEQCAIRTYADRALVNRDLDRWYRLGAILGACVGPGRAAPDAKQMEAIRSWLTALGVCSASASLATRSAEWETLGASGRH